MTNIHDLCQTATDEQLVMIRSIASTHIKWRKDHRSERERINQIGRCLCGAIVNGSNRLRDRGYMVGWECDSCR